MRNLMTTLALTATLAVSVGCGSKPKPQTNQPEIKSETVDRDPEPAAQPEPAAAPEPEPTQSAELQDVIYFEFDSSILSDDARSALNDNYEWLKESQARTLTIEGHTDEKGTDEYNLGLGDRRARAAKDYLVRLGIDASRIKIITYGEERPASPQDEQNRRNVFVATKK